MQTLVFLPLRGAVVLMREIVICVYFYPPPVTILFSAHLLRSHRLTCFRVLWLIKSVPAISTSFLGRNNIFDYFFREIPYSRNVKLQSAITPVL